MSSRYHITLLLVVCAAVLCTKEVSAQMRYSVLRDMMASVPTTKQTKLDSLKADSLAAAKRVQADSLAKHVDSTDISFALLNSGLEDLLNTKVQVSTNQERAMRDAPGIISLITRDEIEASGATDLMDVLRFVPGFEIAHDVSGVFGIGVRGNWGHEGKVLLLVDGILMNELLYGTAPINGRISLENVDRIEVLRGPGSAKYGGFAELGVVNVITKTADAGNAVHASSYGSQMGALFGSRTASLTAKGMYGDYSFSLSGTTTDNITNNQMYKPKTGVLLDKSGLFSNNNTKIQARAQAGNFIATAIVEKYAIHGVWGEDYSLSNQSFDGYMVDAQYNAEIASHVQWLNRVQFVHSTPWYTDPSQFEDYQFTKEAQRTSANSTISYDAMRLHLSGGAQFYQDKGIVPDSSVGKESFYFNGESLNELSINNFALFAEAGYKVWAGEILCGLRYENNSVYGGILLPRVNVNTRFLGVDFKGQYHRSFKAPTIENISLNNQIKPEYADIGEIQASFTLSKNFYANAGIFIVGISRPIYYYVNGTTEYYRNATATGSEGAELELRYKDNTAWVNIGYSLYYTRGNDVWIFQPVGSNISPEQTLAFPNHKITLQSSYKLSDNINLNASLIANSSRSAVEEDSLNFYGYSVVTLPGTIVANANIQWRDIASSGLSATVGVSNLFDSNQSIIQAYYPNTPLVPIPGASRQTFLRLSYNLNFGR